MSYRTPALLALALLASAPAFAAEMTPVGTWTSLTVPLACFQAAGGDLSSVSTPFLLENHGAFTVSITGIRLDTAGADAKCPGIVATQ